MAAQMPDLQAFFNSLLQAQPLGASPGLGTGPSAMGRPSPGPVQPTAGGEGIRALFGMLQPKPGQVAATRRMNMNSPGAMIQHMFNQDSFPQTAPNTPSPFPPRTTTPVPVPQFPSDPPGTPVPSMPPLRQNGPTSGPSISPGGPPPSPDELGHNMTPEQRRAWEEWQKNNPWVPDRDYGGGGSK